MHALFELASRHTLLLLILCYLIEIKALLWAAYRGSKGQYQGSAWYWEDVFLFVGLFVLLQITITFLPPLKLNDLIYAILCMGLVFVVCILVFLLVVKVRGVAPTKAFALDIPIPWKTCIAWAIVSVSLFTGFSFLYDHLCKALQIKVPIQAVLEMFEQPGQSKFETGLTIFLGAFVAPILEEIIFRGMIYQMLRSKFNVRVSIFVSATLFSVVHMEVSAMLPIFFIGCVLAYSLEKTRSLRVPIMIHCLENGMVFVFAVLNL